MRTFSRSRRISGSKRNEFITSESQVLRLQSKRRATSIGTRRRERYPSKSATVCGPPQ
jgi:hypothetical protein